MAESDSSAEVFAAAFILTCIFTPPFIWVNLSTVNQTAVNFSVQDFYIADPQSTNSSNSNQSTIYLNLHIRNGKDNMRVYHDRLNLTFSYYGSQGNIIPLGNYTIPGFHQGLNKETNRNVSIDGIPFLEISKNASSGVGFRVDLACAVRFRDNLSKVKSKKRKIMAWAKVEVDPITGKKVSKKAVKLDHMLKHHPSGWIIFAYVMIAIMMSLSICCCGIIIASSSGSD